jgi:hypothetical protein
MQKLSKLSLESSLLSPPFGINFHKGTSLRTRWRVRIHDAKMRVEAVKY